MPNKQQAIVNFRKKRTEHLLLDWAKGLGHTQPREELNHGLHSLVNNLLIDLMHYCGEDMIREQVEEALGHYQAELSELSDPDAKQAREELEEAQRLDGIEAERDQRDIDIHG